MKAGKYKVGYSEYSKPTPRIFRRIGDTLLAISGTISTTAVLHGNKVIAIVGIATGIIGKFMTNLFSE